MGVSVGRHQVTGSSGPGLNVNAPPFSSQDTTSLCVTASKTVLLQTALTIIHNPNHPTISQRVRAILDLGSQRSYLTQRAARSLSLESEGTRKMSIFTFGSLQGTLSDCEFVQVVMETQDGGMGLRNSDYPNYLRTTECSTPYPVCQFLRAPLRSGIGRFFRRELLR